MIYGGLGMEFIVKENENHQLESIVNKNDKYKMNWVATGKMGRNVSSRRNYR